MEVENVIEAATIIIIAGILAGLTRAGLGYLNRPESELFRPKAFMRSVIISLLLGVSVAYGLAVQGGQEASLLTFFGTYLSVMGTDWLIKEGYDILS